MTAYVYHVIGTLTWRHIELSLESLGRQNIRWDRFVLYNGGDFPDQDILELVPDCFDRIEVFPYDRSLPRSVMADWGAQVDGIGGADRYLVHKADFYLPDGTCDRFEQLAHGDWWVLFNKLDMKEWATGGDFRRYAAMSWEAALADEWTVGYEDSGDGVAVSFTQGVPRLDGTMHGYTDRARRHFHATETEASQRWDQAYAIQRLSGTTDIITDPFFAIHMWHEVPEKRDPKKLIAGRRF